MSKGFHNGVVIVGRSIQKLAAHRRRPEHFLPALCILVDVLPEHGQRVGLWIPETTAYTDQNT